MEPTDRTDLARWVARQMATLDPETAWNPNVTRRLAELHRRQSAPRHRALPWVLAATAIAVGALSLPETRTFAARCLDACLAFASGGGQEQHEEAVRATARDAGPGTNDRRLPVGALVRAKKRTTGCRLRGEARPG